MTFSDRLMAETTQPDFEAEFLVNSQKSQQEAAKVAVCLC